MFSLEFIHKYKILHWSFKNIPVKFLVWVLWHFLKADREYIFCISNYLLKKWSKVYHLSVDF